MHLGQCYMVGFYGDAYNDELEKLISKYKVGGLILFQRNIPATREKLKALTTLIYERYKSLNLPKPFISIDHEGGRVHRMGHLATHYPPAALLTCLNETDFEAIYEQQGRELRYFGINMILGPVIDLCSPHNLKSHIGPRAFSGDPQEVSRRGVSAIKGLASQNVIATPKHFPVYGEDEVDPHYGLQVSTDSLEKLHNGKFIPFTSVIKNGAKVIMSCHVLNKNIDPDLPATLSEKWGNYLRKEMNFKGVMLSDDFCMKAIWERYSINDITIKGIEAGQDILLICHTQDEFEGVFEKSYEILKSQVAKSDEFANRVKNALTRVAALKEELKAFEFENDDKVFADGAQSLLTFWRKYSNMERLYP